MNDDRRQEALRIRISAAELAANRPHPRHEANDDEQKFRMTTRNECSGEEESVPSYLASFTKGLAHDYQTGLVRRSDDFLKFVKAIDSGDPQDFRNTPLGPRRGRAGWKSEKAKEACKGKGALVRAWESQSAGNSFELEGPDAQAVTMPPAPALGSSELTAEIAEVYAQALLRDVPFRQIVDESGEVRLRGGSSRKPDTSVKAILDLLNRLPWFADSDCCKLTPEETGRKRGRMNGQNAFRGITPGDEIGPYISQFLLAGHGGIHGNDNDEERTPKSGLISYGALTIDQRVRTALPFDDHMTTWDEWFDVQRGADLQRLELYVGKDDKAGRPLHRFITTPRDLATYVHYDALYEAYLNACLLLLGNGVPFDPDIPFQAPDRLDHQQGFALFGPPHILSLVTEVATRALKAVRYQKFNVHRRLRPEALAARLARQSVLDVPELNEMVRDPALAGILKLIARKNGIDPLLKRKNFLLPMAFCEGSPMHPSYGAGHATVAGACVTILKAFFDHKHPLSFTGDMSKAFVPSDDGKTLQEESFSGGPLTVEGELNKLASNISIGRDWAGVHYFSDYIESLRMGEQIAIGILEEQKVTYRENFSMTVPLYDGGSIRI